MRCENEPDWELLTGTGSGNTTGNTMWSVCGRRDDGQRTNVGNGRRCWNGSTSSSGADCFETPFRHAEMHFRQAVEPSEWKQHVPMSSRQSHSIPRARSDMFTSVYFHSEVYKSKWSAWDKLITRADAFHPPIRDLEHIANDGACFQRCLSMKHYGNQDEHVRIRRQMAESLIKAGKLMLEWVENGELKCKLCTSAEEFRRCYLMREHGVYPTQTEREHIEVLASEWEKTFVVINMLQDEIEIIGRTGSALNPDDVVTVFSSRGHYTVARPSNAKPTTKLLKAISRARHGRLGHVVDAVFCDDVLQHLSNGYDMLRNWNKH